MSLHSHPLPPRHYYLRQVHRLIHPPRRVVRDPQISSFAVRMPRLPQECSGLRIVQLSDIHYSLYLPPATAERAVELANRLQPDIIALTGDFVTATRQFIEPVADLLAQLRARLGVFAVLGNHDFRVDAAMVSRALARRRIRVLRNTHRRLQVGGARITIAGIDDARQRPDLAAALGARHASGFTLLLAHSPASLSDAAASGVDLVLSGHTHGGQINFGIAAPFYDRHFPSGFLQSGQTCMYVSRGLGKVILPWRVGCPPEIACLTLRRE